MSNQAAVIDNFLKSYGGGGSPLAGLGNVFVAAGKKYGVSPALLVGIAGAESSMGKYVPEGSHNAWGWGPGIDFGSWAEGISTIARGLKSGYIDQGRTTPALIAPKWAPAPTNDPAHWSQTVSDFMKQLGATPSASAAMTVQQSQPTPTTTKTTSSTSSIVKTTPAKAAQTIAAPIDTSGIDSLILQAQTLTPSHTGVQQAALANLQQIASTGHISGTQMLSGIAQGLGYDQAANQAAAAQSSSLTSELQALKSQLTATPPPTPATPATPTLPTTPTTPAGTTAKAVAGSSAPLTNPTPGHYPRLHVVSTASINGVNPKLLNALEAISVQLGKPISIQSGYRSPSYSAKVGGYSNDPHTRGEAVDAYIDGKPIGDVVSLATFAKYGLEGGNSPGFYNGKTDSEHVQIPGSGVNKDMRSPTLKYATGVKSTGNVP